MLKVNGHKNKNTSRPKKTGTRKRRRVLEHKRRLEAMGVPAAKIIQMTPRQILDLLKYPKKTLAAFAK
ncbi:MAG: hypothetical protein HRT88_01395 [Lentisphaeraceae bacterium]|nr:hypothetical protein [Lentisphaeraceae bacterium]